MLNSIGKDVKDVKKSTREENFYIFILNQLENGSYPCKIAKELGISRQQLNYYLSSLKQAGYVKKIGYGVWERCKNDNPQDVKMTTRLARDNPQKIFTSSKPDSVRAHAFQFTFSIPQGFRNWEKRREILGQLGIPFKELKVFGGGEQVEFKGRKVWLTPKSIIIFEKTSYMAETAAEAKSCAIAEALEVIKSFEKYLHANLGSYRFKVSRQHYSLIKNALARQYDKEGKKLEVYNDSGLWFVIDNSFNLHEAEAVHPNTSPADATKVQDFFNGIKQYEGFTPQFIVNSLGGMIQNANLYNANIASHIKAIQDLGAGVAQYNAGIGELLKTIKELKK